MDVYGFFSKLKKQVAFHREDQTLGDTDMMGAGGSVASSGGQSDREDDGYLLVGETRSERTTVFTSTFSEQGGPNAPPMYRQTSNELPSYESVLSGEVPIVAGPVMFSRVGLSPLQAQPSVRNHRSAVSDVPFQLHPSLTAHQSISSMLNDIDLNPQHFNWGRYSHDFMNEKLCLRDMNCDEEANIDEFLTATSNTPNTDVNLMQF